MAVSIEQLPFDLASFERAEAARLDEREQALKALSQAHFVSRTDISRWRLKAKLESVKKLPVRINRHLVVMP